MIHPAKILQHNSVRNFHQTICIYIILEIRGEIRHEEVKQDKIFRRICTETIIQRRCLNYGFSKNVWKIESPRDVNKVTLPSSLTWQWDIKRCWLILPRRHRSLCPMFTLRSIFAVYHLAIVSRVYFRRVDGLRLRLVFAVCDNLLLSTSTCPVPIKLITVNFITLSCRVNIFPKLLILYLMLEVLTLLLLIAIKVLTDWWPTVCQKNLVWPVAQWVDDIEKVARDAQDQKHSP